MRKERDCTVKNTKFSKRELRFKRSSLRGGQCPFRCKRIKKLNNNNDDNN